MRTIIAFVVVLNLLPSVRGREVETWGYQKMFDKADLVVIAKFLVGKDTEERTILKDYGPDLTVLGVVSDFQTCITLKGSKDIQKFQLYHYRYQSEDDEFSHSNMPELIRIKTGCTSNLPNVLDQTKRRQVYACNGTN